MSNVLNTVGHDIQVAAEDVAKTVEAPIKFIAKAEHVIAYAIKEQPELKAAVLQLVTQAEGVIGDVATAAASKGVNLASDAKALADAEQFFAYFRDSFIPLVEQVYSEVSVDIQ